MRKVFASAVVLANLTLFGSVSAAQDRFERPPVRVDTARAGGALTARSSASPRAVVVQYLRARGHDEATAESLVLVSQSALRKRVARANFEQRVGRLVVYGTSVKAAFNDAGALIHVIENVAPISRTIASARINGQQAIDLAVTNLYPGVRTNTPRYWHQPPRATPVAVPAADGTLSTGFLVETWTQSTNELTHTLVSGDGAILEVESRTSADSYNVFTKNPTTTPQQVIAGPGAGNAESPTGWLFAGAQGSTHIQGNNANSYLDVVSNNRSDAEGDGIGDGNFLTAADLSITPSDPGNREVAVQNLFYLNNVIHDELYRHGFVEAAGNFQENNFSNGGRDSDSVNAEAQDGGGTDNANFATPPDGQNPRMQMYLWTGKGTHEVAAGGTSYRAEGAVFGPALDSTGVIGPLRLATDGTAPNVNDGCEALQGFVSGSIALLDRGTCTFTVKVKNAQLAGAVAVIVANNQGDSIFVMGGSDASINIPSVFVSQTDGATLKGLGTLMTIVRRKDPPPIQRDSDVDSDVVFHEYCHGLTWRMIDKMSGPVAGAIGEGMSDVCALLMNEDDVIGEYSFDDPRGIRRFPYTNYPNTYADLTGAGVHDDGELYAAIGWQMYLNFGAGRKSDLFGYLVEGMNFTPPRPTFEQMRDGILAAITAAGGMLSPGSDACLVWDAFAGYGVGVGSSAKVKGKLIIASESMLVPAECNP
jgi:extracellular elastinolytic metalloproteinase